MIIYSGIEWDYNNLEGIGYDSDTLLEPYATYFIEITDALNIERETLNIISEDGRSQSIYANKENLIKLKENYSKNVGYNEIENFTISDDYIQKLKKTNHETISIVEGETRKITKRVKESKFFMLDEGSYKYKATGDTDWTEVELMELSGSTALYDFELNNGVWNEDDFEKWCGDN